jgi:hypothetical protein
MAITRPPKSKASDAKIQALIEKGGQPARQETGAAASPPMAVSLRIPGPLAERLDTFLRERIIRVPRHAWILQAILEKLDRETGE